MNELPRLSPKSLQVLKLVAEGHRFAQIVDSNTELDFRDIFSAAEEAVWLDERLGELPQDSGRTETRPPQFRPKARAKKRPPRAHEPWSHQEDAELSDMYASCRDRNQIAQYFQRKPSAI